MSNVLVIGSEGVIGQHLENRLLLAGYNVYCADRAKKKREYYLICDVTHPETLDKVFLESQPDIVFHLAAEVGRETGELMPSVTVESNVMGTLNVIRQCLAINARLVYLSTSEAYGRLFAEPDGVTEDMTPRGQQCIYGLTKWMGEELVEYYSRRYHLDARICRLFMCYGPGEHSNPYRSAVIRFIEAAFNNKPLYVHKGGMRSWCYITDIVEGIIKVGEYHCDSGFEIFNIGKDDMRDMEWIAKEIVRLTDSQSQIIFTESEPDVTLVKRANFDKAKRLLGWEAQVTIEEGLEKTVGWYDETSDWWARG